MYYSVDEALLFNSGYDANLSIFSSLPDKSDVVVFDEYIHASARDGMRLSQVPASSMFPFKHNSPESLRHVLERLLQSYPGIVAGKTHVFVAVESLYSMDGDFGPLQEIADVCEILPVHTRHLIVDEAHSVGCFGVEGKGLVSMMNLEDKYEIRVHTFSKALANMGGELDKYVTA